MSTNTIGVHCFSNILSMCGAVNNFFSLYNFANFSVCLQGHSVVVRAYPSIAEQSTMSQQEAERITKQRNELGENGLKQKVEELTAAMEENCNPAPAEMLVEVPIPSTDSIQFHPVNVYRYGGEKQLECGLDLNALPMYGEIYDLHTNFVYVSGSSEKII